MLLLSALPTRPAWPLQSARASTFSDEAVPCRSAEQTSAWTLPQEHCRVYPGCPRPGRKLHGSLRQTRPERLDRNSQEELRWAAKSRLRESLHIRFGWAWEMKWTADDAPSQQFQKGPTEGTLRK